MSLSGDGTESEEFLSYYSEIIEEIASTVKFKDQYKYSDYTEDDYLSLIPNKYYRWNLGRRGSNRSHSYLWKLSHYHRCIKKAGITKEDYPRFAGKVINFYVSDVRKK